MLNFLWNGDWWRSLSVTLSWNISLRWGISKTLETKSESSNSLWSGSSSLSQKGFLIFKGSSPF